ncbi:MAG: helix-turn-helix domain-containing protein [Pirellulaceae bacterium]
MAHSVCEWCRKRNVSLLELADRSGLDLPRARAIFLGRWTPSPDERRQVAEVLEVALDEVAWGHETPIQHIYGHGPS